jgi:hypothetical protein
MKKSNFMLTSHFSQHSLLVASAVTLASLSLFLKTDPSQAQALTTNGGFELGDFTDWNRSGVTSLETSAFGSGPSEGRFQALLQTDPINTNANAFVFDLEADLGLPSSSLFDLGAVGGSAITTEVTVNAGDTLSFQWNFLTDELADPALTQNDFAFFTVVPAISPLTGALKRLADTTATFFPSSTRMSLKEETGFQTETITFSSAGTFRLGFGVVDVFDFAGASGLLVDNVKLTSQPTSVPEPSTILGTVVTVALSIADRFRKHK